MTAELELELERAGVLCCRRDAGAEWNGEERSEVECRRRAGTKPTPVE